MTSMKFLVIHLEHCSVSVISVVKCDVCETVLATRLWSDHFPDMYMTACVKVEEEIQVVCSGTRDVADVESRCFLREKHVW